VVQTHAGGVAARGNKMFVRCGKMAEGKRHSGRVVRFRVVPSRVLKGNEWPADVYLEGLTVSRVVSQLVADRHRHPRQGAVSRLVTMGGH